MTNRKVTKLIISETSIDDDKPLKNAGVTSNFKTANRCMYCTLLVKDIIIGCPTHLISEHTDIKHNDKRAINEYMTYGVFCSYNCVKAFILSKEHDPLFLNSSRYLANMALKDYGGIIDIIPSPPIELMIAYGGYMTEEQYSAEIGKIKYTSKGTTVTYPLTLVYNKNINI